MMHGFSTAVRRLLALIALAALLLAPAQSHADPVKLAVWGYTPTKDSIGFDAEAAAFEKLHPDIEVAILSVGGQMNPQKLMTAIVGGVPPDVINQDRFTIGDWASRGAFRPLDDYIRADEHSPDPVAVRRANFVPAAWAETMYRGSVYAIPDSIDDRLLYYNKSCFRDAGLDPNCPPRTWDELIADAKALTRRSPDGGFSRLGFDPLYNQGYLYIWSWQQDGDFLSADGRVCTLDNPRTTAALAAMVGWYDQLGGVDAVNGFVGGFGNAASDQDPFLNGSLAMKTDGTGTLNDIARYAPDIDFGVAPVPIPAERLAHAGRFKSDPTWVTWSGGFSLVIPRGARHPRQAWQFIEWMTSPQAAVIGAKAQSDYQHAKGLPFVPDFSANMVANRLVFGAYTPALSPKLAGAVQTALGLLPYTRYRPVTFVGQLLWDQAGLATDAAIRHAKSPGEALADARMIVQTQLDAARNESRYPRLPARAVTVAVCALVAALALGLCIGVRRWMAARSQSARAEGRAGMLFISPWAIGFAVFTLGPILASLVISFCDYDVLHPARFVGAANYVALATVGRPMVLKSLANVAYLAAFGIPLGMVTSLGFALLLNSKVRGLAWYRTAFYIPSIVPVVASAVLWSWILNPDPRSGLINAVWVATLGRWFGLAPPGWLAVPSWSKPGVVLMGLWGAGSGMILWLAGLQSIPASLYEAAALDGAGPCARFRHVTLPVLSPYIFFNLTMGIIGALQTFESAYILGGTAGGGSTGPDDSLLVPVVYLFNNAFEYFKMGYASAIAWVLFVLILGLTLAQVKIAPKWVHYESQAK